MSTAEGLYNAYVDARVRQGFDPPPPWAQLSTAEVAVWRSVFVEAVEEFENHP